MTHYSKDNSLGQSSVWESRLMWPEKSSLIKRKVKFQSKSTEFSSGIPKGLVFLVLGDTDVSTGMDNLSNCYAVRPAGVGMHRAPFKSHPGGDCQSATSVLRTPFFSTAWPFPEICRTFPTKLRNKGEKQLDSLWKNRHGKWSRGR